MVNTNAEKDLRAIRAQRKEEEKYFKKKLKAQRKINDTTEDKIFYVIINFVLALLLLIVAVPILYILACSFSNANAVIAGKVVAWPVEFTMQGYEAIFNNGRYDIIGAFRNSFFYVLAGTSFSLFMTYLCAYPLARKTMPFKGAFTFLFTFTMLFGGGMIPTYIVMKHLGMINNPLIMILPGAIGVHNLIISRT